jgi:SlyX protein
MDTPLPDIDPRIDQRLTDLEVKASYTEDTVEQLNAVIVRQQQQIDALLRHFGELRGQVDRLTDPSGARTLRDELPPHY